ncbi:hypothetical protein GcM1_084007 [Golovinomyces cichoracearum]|uniref:Uncharacterized protein n=1 Tax=Golovinomyces cichoracearum TaxID=62708 RepID=A0A420JC72_9PEZI|nr:hypothetical protein GcM1_084007 [Golovinomyces cichoracearum]
MGLTCFHTISTGQSNYSTTKLSDVNPHWHYQKKEGEQPPLERRIFLEPKINTSEGSPELSTIAIGISRGAGGIRDLYEVGIARKRAYMRSIKFDKLGSAMIEELHIEIVVDVDVQEDN